MNKKEQMIAALRAFVNQRSGIEFGNYASGDWKHSHKIFMEDYRPILKYGRHARAMLAIVEQAQSITEADLTEATSAYSGRLQFITRQDGAVDVDYTTGQYFPTEYRQAACAVLARALRAYWGNDSAYEKAKATLGRGIAQTWFKN